WFDDPLLSHLLRYGKETLADVVFHELFHNTLYIKSSGAFNESLANFVGGRASIDFFREKFGEGSMEHRQALEAWDEQLEFSDFLEELAAELTKLYGLDISLREKLRERDRVFARGKDDWTQRVARKPSHRFRKFSEQSLNNAVMIHYLLYTKELRLFDALYEAQGRDLKSTISVIREAVSSGGEPFEAVKRLLNKV
ncbi:MAG: aminopeptidase, partial [Deltaproteobacteria bacterium]|nr:aminopeptidase [Deltaproteobacteria bacterium]